MASRYNLLENNLPSLQDLIKRDAESYKDEFLQQYRHYEHTLKLFQLQPNLDSSKLIDVVTFLCQVAHCYPKTTKNLATELIDILSTNGEMLDPELRLALCKCLVLLRNKSLAEPLSILQLFFELARIRDKLLRKFIFDSTVSQIKQIKLNKKDPRLNGQLQAFVFAKLNESHAVVCRLALLLCIELYRKRFWQDAKTANAISRACFHKIPKIYVTACKFFLGKDAFDENDGNQSSSDDENDNSHGKNQKSFKEIMVGYKAGKKTRKRKKQLEKTKDQLNKAQTKQKKKHKKLHQLDFSAFHYLYDAQDFGEKLLKKLEKCSDRYEVKITLMALIARIVGIHKLQLLNFYPYLQKYAQPHQRDVTKILLFAAQSVHDLVPPDAVQALLMTIVNNFVSDRNSAEAMTVGLNTVREIAERCPLALDEDLLGDLVAYKSYKNKNVSMAAKGLIQVFRDLNPDLLKKKDRGRPTEASKLIQPTKYFGESRASASFIPGSECLAPKESDQKQDDADQNCETDSEIGDLEEWESDDEVGSASDDESVQADNDDQKEVEPETKEKIAEKRVTFAQNISETKIFSQQDFKRIKAFQLKQHLEPARSKKRKLDEEEVQDPDIEPGTSSDDDDSDKPELTRLSDIEHLHKRAKQDKQARMESIKAGRDPDPKFGRPKPKGSHVGHTNKKMAKKKAYSMVKHKGISKKKKRSFRDKQKALTNYFEKQRKMR